MAFRVYLSHSLDSAEAALAWRLQTLAAVHGITVLVPNYGAKPGPLGRLSVRTAIDHADCVLAIITTAATPNVRNELNYAVNRGKLVIPIVRSDLKGLPFVAKFPVAFTFSPAENPGAVETQIVDFLKNQRLTKDKQQAIGALAALGLGLLALSSFSNRA